MGARGPVSERVWNHYEPEPMSGCWLWTGSVYAKGYGQIAVTPGHSAPAHRIAWEATYGPVPADKWVLHRCDVRTCVNPAHLFLGTNTDNMRDMAAKGRGNTAK